MAILFIDNFDSFAHNLARYFRLLGQSTHVVRNDAVSIEDVVELQPDAVVLSPGPKSPTEAGICVDLIRRFSGEIPILGVCLGHQCIAAAFGGQIIRVPPVHGRGSEIRHLQSELFAELPCPMTVARYHSLAVDRATMPPSLTVTAESKDGLVMALRHVDHLTMGVQFHPESVLSEYGIKLLKNFLTISGIECDADLSRVASECTRWQDSDREVAT